MDRADRDHVASIFHYKGVVKPKQACARTGNVLGGSDGWGEVGEVLKQCGGYRDIDPTA